MERNNDLIISVVIVTFNCGTMVRETIDSFAHQTYRAKELIVIDGGSDAETLSILREYRNHINVLITEPDKGIYDAMNKGLDQSKGDFLIFMGSDDHFVSYDTLERVARHLTDQNTVYYGDVWRPLNNDIYCRKFYKYKLAVKNISHQAIFYPKSIYKEKKYNLKYKLMADYAYNIELWGKAEYQYIREPISFITQFGASSTGKDEVFENDRRMLVCKNLGAVPYLYALVYHFLRNLIKRDR